MATETIRAAIVDIRRRLEKGQYADVERTKWGIVVRLLRCLGWDALDDTVVQSDYSVGHRAVDFALLGPQSAPAVLVEIQDPNVAVSGESHGLDRLPHGDSILVTTTGRRWELFLVGAGRSDGAGAFCTVDLVDTSREYAAESLRRYLLFDAVRSGEAVGHAVADHRNANRSRQVAETLPHAWRALAAQPSETLVHLLQEEVERQCGARPSREETVRFLGSRAEKTGRDEPVIPNPRRTTGRGEFSFTFDGRTRQFRTGKDLLREVFVAFANRDSSFCQRFHEQFRGTTRPYLARRREDLYPDQSGLDLEIGRLPGGWFIGTHMGGLRKKEMIQRACEIEGIDFDSLQVEIPIQSRKKKQ